MSIHCDPLIAAALGDIDVRYVWRFLRAHKIDFWACKSWGESNDPDFAEGLGIIRILGNRERIEAELFIELRRYNGETQALIANAGMVIGPRKTVCSNA